MESLAFVPDWKVQSHTLTPGGDVTAVVTDPNGFIWDVRIDPRGIWHFSAGPEIIPEPLEREAIMITVGTYFIRWAFGVKD